MEPFLLTADQLRARDGGKWKKYPADVIPAFVADMDFKVAPAVQAAIGKLTDSQDYGYGQAADTDALSEAFSGWMDRRHGWRPDPALTIANRDVIQGLYSTILAFSEPGDGVIVQATIYPPFLRDIEGTRSRDVVRTTAYAGTRYAIDIY